MPNEAILLHASLSPDWFVRVAELLAGYRVLRPHRAGYGRSADLTDGATVAAHARHCAEILRAARVTRAHVVGHSSGGCVALQFAATYPDLVGSVVLLETARLQASDEPDNPAQRSAITAGRAGEYEKGFDLFLTALAGPGYREVILRELGEQGLREAIATSRYFFQTEVPALAAWEFGFADARQITAPVLLVEGAESKRIAPAYLHRNAELARHLPNAQRLTLPGVGHAMPLEDPALIVRTVRDVLARHQR